MKRPHGASDSSESSTTAPKKARVDPYASVKNSQPGADLADSNDQNPAVFDSQMKRALCIALQNAGFTSVKKQALESFGFALDQYMRYLTQRAATSMKSCRRIQPIPQDFAFSLKAAGLAPRDLALQLDPRRARSKSKSSGKTKPQPPETNLQPKLDLQNPTESALVAFPHPSKTPNTTLNQPLKPDADEQKLQKKRPGYIPSHMPVFPAPHTYMSTLSAESKRESDPRRIRQLAIDEGVLAEQAMRKLMAAKNPYKDAPVQKPEAHPSERPAHQRRSLRDQHHRSEDAFMAALTAADDSDKTVSGKPVAKDGDVEMDLGNHVPQQEGANVSDKAEKDEGGKTGLGGVDLGVSVNWDMRNWRNGAGM
ncbi:MAG: hypothetical protein M1831_005628 [Alyxoria varia]|nr:MAG: hypothetical protein M1831_005628 [Alyxoria varia]